MRKIFVALLFIVGFFLRLFLVPRLDLKDGQLVRVSGRLTEEPQVTANRQTFKLGQFEITTQRWPEYHYGEEIEVVGKIKYQKSNIKNTRLAVGQVNKKLKRFLGYFNSEKYLLSYPKIEVIKDSESGGGVDRNGRGLPVKRAAVWVRLKVREIFNRSFPVPYDGIMTGVVLGDRSLISQDWWNKFKMTGTLHIMVASGSNIVLFTSGLLRFLCVLFVRRISLLVLISLIWFYALMTGLQPPIIRAAIMASLLYLGEFFGRKKEGKNVLWLTGAVMLLLNPFLISDIGFQLSFLATMGLVYIQPKLKILSTKLEVNSKHGNRTKSEIRNPKHETNSNFQNPNDKNVWNIRILNFVYFVSNFVFERIPEGTIRISNLLKSDNFTSSLAAFLATTPILLLNFGQLNLLSPFINLAILWVIPWILQFGMGIGIIGIIGEIGLKTARVASFLPYPLLYYLEKLIELASKWTFLQLEGVKIGWGWAIGYYLLLWVWVKNKNQNSNIKDQN